ncbi:hypothetical protein VNO77_37900 [Canavalia gladiata]|uniref:RecA family profile 2 domain-containing protein n=1 Tax=Canavalia gladiata TaxID=3824 RepID=A0AAN9K9A7_CANGL
MESWSDTRFERFHRQGREFPSPLTPVGLHLHCIHLHFLSCINLIPKWGSVACLQLVLELQGQIAFEIGASLHGLTISDIDRADCIWNKDVVDRVNQVCLRKLGVIRLAIGATKTVQLQNLVDLGMPGPMASAARSSSKVSRPYKLAEFEIIFGEGVSKLGCILDCAEMMDIVSKKGSWYSYGDHRLGQGRDKAIQYLKENTHLLEEIEKVVRSSLIEGTSQSSLAYVKNSPVLHQDEDMFEESHG